MNTLKDTFKSSQHRLNFQFSAYSSAVDLCAEYGGGVWDYKDQSYVPVHVDSGEFVVNLNEGQVSLNKDDFGLLATTKTLEKLTMNPKYSYLIPKLESLMNECVALGIYPEKSKATKEKIKALFSCH